jgi:hypothetical protein
METKKLIEMSLFWHNKTDDECIKMATKEGSHGSDIDAEEALINMFERDFWTQTNTNIINELTKQVLVEKYVREGVHEEKIIITKEPNTANWSVTRKCLIEKNNIDTFEVIDNIWIPMLTKTNFTKEDIDRINNSNGIVCTSCSDGFRYGFIPS